MRRTWMWILDVIVIGCALVLALPKLESQAAGGGQSAPAASAEPACLDPAERHGGYEGPNVPNTGHPGIHRYDVDQAENDEKDPKHGPICVHRNELMRWKTQGGQKLFDISFSRMSGSSADCKDAPVVQDEKHRTETTSGCRPQYLLHLMSPTQGVECTYKVTINFGKPCGDGPKIDPHVRTN